MVSTESCYIRRVFQQTSSFNKLSGDRKIRHDISKLSKQLFCYLFTMEFHLSEVPIPFSHFCYRNDASPTEIITKSNFFIFLNQVQTLASAKREMNAHWNCLSAEIIINSLSNNCTSNILPTPHNRASIIHTNGAKRRFLCLISDKKQLVFQGDFIVTFCQRKSSSL